MGVLNISYISQPFLYQNDRLPGHDQCTIFVFLSVPLLHNMIGPVSLAMILPKNVCMEDPIASSILLNNRFS